MKHSLALSFTAPLLRKEPVPIKSGGLGGEANTSAAFTELVRKYYYKQFLKERHLL